MAFCTACGNRLPENANVCPSCGKIVNAAAAKAARQNQTAAGGAQAEAPTPAYAPDNGQNPEREAGQPTGQPAGQPTPVQPEYQRVEYTPPYPAQGQPYQTIQPQGAVYSDPSGVVGQVLSKMSTAATVWMVIGILQIVLGVCELCMGYGAIVIAIGIWNIVNSNKKKKNAEYFRKYPVGIYSYYEPLMTTNIIFLCLNLFLGSFIGIVGSIYDIALRSYVMSHRDDLIYVEQQVLNQQ